MADQSFHCTFVVHYSLSLSKGAGTVKKIITLNPHGALAAPA